MKSRALVLVASGAALAAAIVWSGRLATDPPSQAAGAPMAVGAPGSVLVATPNAPAPAKSTSEDAAPVDPVVAAAARTAPPTAHRQLAWSWPMPNGRAAVARAAPRSEPAVTVELAFQALRYVGIDPAAEQTWRRAIDDPDTPAGVRSDLIEDLNQEGYLDNSHPTKADLPLIMARLDLIERLAPHAIDDVNESAFQEAYKDLLAMYLRLGGAPRPRK